MRPPAEGEELFVDLDRLSDEQRADLRRRLGLLGGDFNRELALEWATLKLALCAALAGCCAWALRAGGGSPGFRAVLFGAGVILLAGLAIFLRFGLYLALEELRPVLSWAAPGAYPALERSWQSGWRLWWLCTAASGSLALGLAALLTCARNSPRAGSTAGPGALGMSREPR